LHTSPSPSATLAAMPLAVKAAVLAAPSAIPVTAKVLYQLHFLVHNVIVLSSANDDLPYLGADVASKPNRGVTRPLGPSKPEDRPAASRTTIKSNQSVAADIWRMVSDHTPKSNASACLP
jgi:hypothetical protein